ncbi:tRNA pseudouridine(55) synthase TruB [Adhaeretor mobilis]|uniref:tRNA pseudouridine synthase B n=1 Tax=Adhaeretor mobilis TaxID=1930276 RepID=A0A517MSG8_9BACT|nr:tRNA pseudouridine(55) synthase TruB [Adhaeretor mobilis]QDS97818.1 tRNA pseudouridine synthase B [Adhaeretor mobilis]
MFGILNINKPAGCTSRDVVNRVQRLVKPVKCGHAGTLDPLATGVLVVCLGGATRLIEYVQQMPKTYRGTFLLGQSSPSDDVETEITQQENAPRPTLAEIGAALPQFLGTIQQRPPAYSAIKQQGQRAYKLAREGKQVELAARPVTIHSLAIERYDYPELELTIHCGSGTYVRSLGRDLAKSLGTCAVMSQLARTAIGRFAVADGLSLEGLQLATIEQNLQPARLAVEQLPTLTLTAAQWEEISHGREIAACGLAEEEEMGDDIETDSAMAAKPQAANAAVNEQGELIALLKRTSLGKFRATRNFLKPS